MGGGGVLVRVFKGFLPFGFESIGFYAVVGCFKFVSGFGRSLGFERVGD